MDRLGAGFVGTGCAVSTHRVEAWPRGRNSEIALIWDLDEARTDKTTVLCRKLVVNKPKLTRINRLVSWWWRVCHELETG